MGRPRLNLVRRVGLGVEHRGGYYDNGRVAEPLRDGAASLVIYQDGTATVGQWSRDVRLTSNVRSVRQNLGLLVDGGQVSQTCSSDSSPQWGYTVGNDAYVPRTALGVRSDGALVFVNSPAVSVCSLGQLLKSAGVQRGMELPLREALDIERLVVQEYFSCYGEANQGVTDFNRKKRSSDL